MRILSLGLALVAVLAVTACAKKTQQTTTTGGGTEGTQTTAPGSTTTPASTSGGDPAAAASYQVPKDLDQGPRASASPVDAKLAAQGAKVFQSRGCATCHAFGKKLIGPDLKPVASQRTEKWMEAQILHPDKMTQQDPTAKQLLAQYKTQMTNQGLSPEEAKQVIEYIKQQGKK